MVVSYDPFSAPKRDRKQTIPFRHGRYDQGKKFYDEKIITLECRTEARGLTKAEMREVIFWLSQKSNLVIWDEPDKFYVGELLQSAAVDVLARGEFRQFTLPLICEPFAYGRQVTQQIHQGDNVIEYGGTIETPTMLVIHNPNDFPVTGITVRAVKSRR